MARAAELAGAQVVSQIRYKFGQDSPPGFAAVVMLDESHCSGHTYADLGMIALDVFTCGETDPRDVLKYLREDIDLGDVTVREVPRFEMVPSADAADVSASCPRELHAGLS
jgi:S-adenosylmethionine decarboxylase